MTDFDRVTLSYTTEQGFSLDDDTRVGLRVATTSEHMAFGQALARTSIYIPKEVADALANYHRTFNAISASPAVANQYPAELVYSDDSQLLLSKARAQVVRAMRDQLGTDPLSERTLSLIGRAREEGTAADR